MSNSYNRVIITGNLTRDPELKTLPGGTSVCRISVAVNESWKDKDGAKRESTAYVDCDFFGKTAEVIARFFERGRPILVEGKLKQDNWTDKQSGEKRSKLGVLGEQFSFIGGDGKPAAGGEPRAPREERSRPMDKPAPSAAPDEGGDVPF